MSNNLTINYLKDNIDFIDKMIKHYQNLIEETKEVIGPEESKSNLTLNFLKNKVKEMMREKNNNLEKMTKTKLLIELHKYKNILYY